MLNPGRKSCHCLYCFQNILNFILVHLDCCCLVTKLCLTRCDPMTAAHQAPLPFTISWNLLKFMSIESVMPSNHCILYQPRLLLSSIFPSIDVFSKELALHMERLFLNHEKTLGFLASGGEEFNPGPEKV